VTVGPRRETLKSTVFKRSDGMQILERSGERGTTRGDGKPGDRKALRSPGETLKDKTP